MSSVRPARRTGDDRSATVEALRERLRSMQGAQVMQSAQVVQGARQTQPSAAPERAEVAQLADVVRGLRSGAVHSIGSRSLALACLGAVLPAGSWGAIVGMPDLGIEAAADLGVPMDRVALVPHPGCAWLDVVASLAEAMPVVLAVSPGRVAGTDAARLAARLRQASSTLLVAGAWRGAATSMRSVRTQWQGLAAGDGRVAEGSVVVEVTSPGAQWLARIPLVAERSRLDQTEHSQVFSPRHAEAA